jgi:glycosyltransferase involved in cell wall biosynthesis
MTRTRSLAPVDLSELESEPLVSILIASYNYGRFLEEALESVRAQSYSRLEELICDDASTDDSLSRARRFSRVDRRFRVLSQSNSGQAAAWNTAFAASSGSVVALLDADDYFDSDKVTRIVERFRKARAGAVLHALRVINVEGRATGQIPVLGRVEEGWIADDVVRRGGRWRFLQTTALSFRRDVGHLIFPIPTDIRLYSESADAFVFILLPLLTTIAYIDAPLAAYRVHGSNATLRISNQVQRIRENAATWVRVLQFVNERLAFLGSGDTLLRVERNPEFRQRQYLAELLEGILVRPALLARFLRLVPIIAADDVYSMAQRAAMLAVLGSAIALPAARRARWIEIGWGAGPAAKRATDRARLVFRSQR